MYKTTDGNLYPSVTSTFSVLDHTYLDEWRERVGDEEADHVSTVATQHGTRVHGMAEALIKNEFDARSFNPFMIDAFVPLARHLVDHVDHVLGSELQMYSNRLRVAGTSDLIALYDGVLSIVDFKTARRTKRREDIPTYFMQGAAYSAMAYEMLGIEAKQIVILMLVEGEGLTVFIESVADHLKEFVSVRRKFREINGI